MVVSGISLIAVLEARALSSCVGGTDAVRTTILIVDDDAAGTRASCGSSPPRSPPPTWWTRRRKEQLRRRLSLARRLRPDLILLEYRHATGQRLGGPAVDSSRAARPRDEDHYRDRARPKMPIARRRRPAAPMPFSSRRPSRGPSCCRRSGAYVMRCAGRAVQSRCVRAGTEGAGCGRRQHFVCPGDEAAACVDALCRPASNSGRPAGSPGGEAAFWGRFLSL